MYYTELEFISHLVNNVDIGDDYGITNHELKDFFESKRVDVPEEYKYIEQELLAVRKLYPETIKWCKHSYYGYLAAILTSIYNDGLKVPPEFFSYLDYHKCLFPTIDHLSNILIMVYLPKRTDYLLMERDNRVISRARLYHRIGYNLILSNNGGFINEHEKEFFDLISEYDFNGPFYVRTMLIGFYYINHELYDISLDSLKKSLDDIDIILDKMDLNEMNYENMNEEMVLNHFQNCLNKIIIK